MLPLNERITVIRPGVTTDGHGNPAKDWSDDAVTTREFAGAFAPSRLSGPAPEVTGGGREAVVTHPVVYLEAGADVRATDRVIARGKTYEVDGEPDEWSAFSGVGAGLEVRLRRAVG